MNKVLCVFHGNCDDGFGAAYAVWKRYGYTADYYPAQYGQEPPDVKGRDVVMVDFSYKRPVVEKIIEDAASLILLDHHKSALYDLAPIELKDDTLSAGWESRESDLRAGRRFEIYFDMEQSGAVLAWEYFHPGEPVPELLSYIEDRDLFTKQLPGNEEFTMGLRSYPQEFELWDTFTVDYLIEEGRSILRFYRQKIDEAKQNVMRLEIGGIKVPAVNAPPWMASDLAGELAKSALFAATFWSGPNGTTYSLRSRKDGGVDVSRVAKQYDGGGHEHAAGFILAPGDSL